MVMAADTCVQTGLLLLVVGVINDGWNTESKKHLACELPLSSEGFCSWHRGIRV